MITKLISICLLLIATQSLIPNCAYESNNQCLSCYYGFQLQNGRCNTCMEGFIMVSAICVDEILYYGGQSNPGIQTVSHSSDSSSNNGNWGSTNIVNSGSTPTSSTQNSNSQTESQSTYGSSSSSANNVVQNYVNTQQQQQSQSQSQNSGSGSGSGSSSSASSSSTSSSNNNNNVLDVSNSGVMYLLNMFGLASSIPLNCQKFDTQFNCLECAAGYVLFQTVNTCVFNQASTSTSTSTSTNPGSSSTSTQSYNSGSNSGSSSSSGSQNNVVVNSGQTTNTAAGASTSNSNNDPNCLQSRQTGGCVQCSYRYVQNTQSLLCQKVSDQCNTWNRQGGCVTCYPGYTLQDSACVVGSNTQSQGSQSSYDSGNNQSQNGGAIIVNTNTNSGQQNSNPSTTSGSSANSDPNCLMPRQTGGCDACAYRYVVNQQTLICQKVSDQCQTWNVQGGCLTCYSGYTLVGTACVMSGSSSGQNFGTGSGVGTSGSTTTNGGNTQTNTNTQQNGGAIILTSSDNNCMTPSQTGGCQQCYFSFYYNQQAGRCVSVNPLCKTWNNLGHCLSCYEGYYVISNTCIIQADYQGNLVVGSNDLPANQDPYCHRYQSGICTQCATRTYMDQSTGRCHQIDSNCADWNQQTGVCNYCYKGYYVYERMQCRLMNPEVAGLQLKSELNTDVNCRASDDTGRCTQCIWRYVLNNQSGTCIKVSDLCKTWSQTTALCTACYGGYTLTNDGQCLV